VGLTVLELPARRDQLAEVRLLLSKTIAAELDDDVPARRLDDLRLAVSEACANAVDAQLRAGVDEPLRVAIEVEPGIVAVTVTDHAGGFDPGAVDSLPPVTDPSRLRHERGLGIPLMRSLADEVQFTATGTGTAVRLVVHTRP
jgi:serine/threonine-protein kinase RsbW